MINITKEKLYLKYNNETIPSFIHLSNSDKIVSMMHPQLYVFGQNGGGKPAGVWIAHGACWLKYIDQSTTIKKYLYAYDLELNVKKIMFVNNENFNQFDALVPDYWVNFNLFNVDISGALQGGPGINFDKLNKNSNDTLWDILINNNIIFDSKVNAIAKCDFYAKMDAAEVDLYKYKNWAWLAKNYDGVYFDFNVNSVGYKYYWFKTIDVSSGCIWNISNITKINKVYKILKY
jgi:hypothetical protein